MDEKLQKILRLALHPATGENEAQAALNRARAMVGTEDLDKILGSTAPTVKTEYRDRVIYRDGYYPYSQRSTYRIAPRWQHSFTERLFRDAGKWGCKVEMISCTTEGESLGSRTVLTVNILGDEHNLDRFDSVIAGWFTEMNGVNKPATKPHAGATPRPNPQPNSTTPPKPRTWTQRVLDLFA